MQSQNRRKVACVFGHATCRRRLAVGRVARRSTHKRIRHPEIGGLDLDCDASHDPGRDHWIILYTAAPGTPSHRALQLLKILGTQWSASHTA